MLSAVEDGAVELFYDASKKFETTSAGATVTGSLTTTGNIVISSTSPQLTFTDTNHNPDFVINADGGYFNFRDQNAGVNRLSIANDGDVQIPVDNAKLEIGASQDLQLYHTGSANHIDSLNGALAIRSDVFQISTVDGTHVYLNIPTDEQGVELYYDNSKKFQTFSDGVTLFGDVFFDNQTNAGKDLEWDESQDRLEFKDNVKAAFGDSADLQIYHNGSASYISDTGTGSLYIQGENLVLENTSGVNYLAGVSGAEAMHIIMGLQSLRQQVVEFML